MQRIWLFFLLIVLSVGGTILAVGEGDGGVTGASTMPLSRRIEIYNTGIRLLDEGRNEQAVSFFQKHLDKNPGLIEAADAIVEARQRACLYDSAIAWLATSPFGTGPTREPQNLFLDAHRLRRARDFKWAAAKFKEAAEASLTSHDTLSAAFCLKMSARSALGARDADGSLSDVAVMQQLVSHLEGTDRVIVESIAIRGEAKNLLDKLDEADSLYKHALQKAGEKGYRRIRSYALNGLGKLNEKRQLIAEAVGYYEKALAETRILGSTENIAALLNNMGQAETRLRHFDVAGRYLDEAKDLALSCGSDWMLGYIYYGLGAVAEASGQTDSAKTLFRQSTEHHQRQGNTWGELGARLRLAYSHINLGEYSQAVGQYNRCLDVYEKAGSLYGMSWALGGLALANHRLGNFKKAEEYYKRTLDVRNKLGDRRGAAWCLNSLGMVSDMQGNYREALSYEHEAMEIYEELGDQAGIGSVLFSMGSVYFYLGNFSKSMEHYEKAYAIATEEKDNELLENVASGMGSVYFAAGRMDLAEKFYLEHLEITKGTGELSGIIWSLNNIASFYIQIGDTTKANGYLEEAMTFLPEQGMDHIRSRTLFLYGKTVGSKDAAIDYTKQALELAESNGLKELQWKYLSDLGEYYLRQGDVSTAVQCQERAIRIVESLRHGVGSDELRRHMLRPAITPFGRMISLIVGASKKEHTVKKAFEYAERSKAQIFASLLREALSRIEREEDEKLRHQKDLMSQISHIQSRLQDATLAKDEKARLLGKMARIERDLVQQEIQLAGHQEAYAASIYPVHVEVATLLATLKPSERMISYFLGGKQSYLFTSKSNEMDVFILPNRAAIEEKAGFFLRLLRQMAGEEQGAWGGPSTVSSSAPSAATGAGLPPEVIENASEELYDILLGPITDRLEPDEALVIVPDGILNRLPFALLKKSGICLIETVELFYAPSLQSLYYIRKREAARSRAAAADDPNVIALGSSGGPPGNRGTRRVYPFTRIAIEPLPRAAAEARTIAGMFETSSYLTGSDASERSFKETDLAKADILHIAAHSYIDNEDVRRSFIVLSPEEDAQMERAGREEVVAEAAVPTEDGLLQWHEIAGLRLNASLVTLSACRAAGGVLAYGEGITGLTQAFLYAGGNCVLASVIDVPDRFAGRFMTAFYRNLKKGSSGAEALRAAQLEAMKWDDIAHGPALWGSFALIGDGSFVIAPHVK